MLLPLMIMVGVPVVIMPQFEPEAFCRNIEKHKVTVSLIVPPVCLAVIHHPGTRFAHNLICVGFLINPFSLSSSSNE